MTCCKASPTGDHDWREAAPETADGSTLLACRGCDEIAYRLRPVTARSIRTPAGLRRTHLTKGTP